MKKKKEKSQTVSICSKNIFLASVERCILSIAATEIVHECSIENSRTVSTHTEIASGAENTVECSRNYSNIRGEHSRRMHRHINTRGGAAFESEYKKQANSKVEAKKKR